MSVVNARALLVAAEAKAQWAKGAIVQLMYHSCVPTRDELCSWDDIGGASAEHLTDAQWSELVTDGTAPNAAVTAGAMRRPSTTRCVASQAPS